MHTSLRTKHSSPPLSVQAATIVKLVERLTFEKFIDIRFQGKFLLTFRAFMTPAVLFETLQKRCVKCRSLCVGCAFLELVHE